jgi:hypothetical protein
MPQVRAGVVEKPGVKQLAANTEVKINGPVSTLPTDTIDRAQWVGNQYFLDITGEGGNELHAIIEFFYYMSSPERAADFYVIRIMSKTTPKPDDGNWKLASSGIDDPIGPANEVYAKVTKGAIRWDWCVPWATLDYEEDQVVQVEETYSVGASLEGSAQIFIPEALTQLGVKGTISGSYKLTNRYTVTLYKWTIQPYGGSVDYRWKLGLNTGHPHSAERSEAIGEYLLVLTVGHGQSIHMDNFQFWGNCWHWCWPGFMDMHEDLWGQIESIDLCYNGLRTLTIQAGYGGTTSPSPGSYVYGLGEQVAVSATATVTDYKFYYWLLDGIDVGTKNPYTVTMDSDHTLKAVFRYTGPTSCVAEGTPVTMADGSTKLIEKIKKGDQVLGYDPTTCSYMAENVLDTLKHQVEVIVNINNGMLKLTPTDQPIFIRNATYEGWVRDPATMEVGWEIFNATSGSWVPVTSITIEEGRTRVYDLVLDGYQTFIANSILLMDKC